MKRSITADDGDLMNDWLEFIQKLVPLVGVPGAILAFGWWNAERAHGRTLVELRETREELKRCNELRVSETMRMTEVIEGNTSQLGAHDKSQDALQATINTYTNAVNNVLFLGSRR